MEESIMAKNEKGNSNNRQVTKKMKTSDKKVIRNRQRERKRNSRVARLRTRQESVFLVGSNYSECFCSFFHPTRANSIFNTDSFSGMCSSTRCLLLGRFHSIVEQKTCTHPFSSLDVTDIPMRMRQKERERERASRIFSSALVCLSIDEKDGFFSCR